MGGRSDKKNKGNAAATASTLIIGAAFAGGKSGNTNFNFQGRMDEFMLSARALSTSEIKAIFSMGNPY